MSIKAYYTTFKYLCKSWLFHFNCKKKRKPINSAKKSPYEVQRKIKGLINKKKINKENNQYKKAFEGFYMEMMGTLNMTSKAREMNPNDESIKTINDACILIVKRINWWKENFDIPVDEDSPKLEY